MSCSRPICSERSKRKTSVNMTALMVVTAATTLSACAVKPGRTRILAAAARRHPRGKRKPGEVIERAPLLSPRPRSIRRTRDPGSRVPAAAPRHDALSPS